MDLASFICGFVWGAAILIFVLNKLTDITPKKRYIYACTHDECDFAIRASHHSAGFLEIIDRHERTAHGDDRPMD